MYPLVTAPVNVTRMAEQPPAWAKELRRVVRLRLVEQDRNDADLARQIGWSSSRLSQYMTGKSRPSAVDVIAIAEALDLDPVEVASIVGYNLEGLREPTSSLSAADVEERLTQLERRVLRLERRGKGSTR